MDTVAIIGIGRMGSLISRKLSNKYSLILVDVDLRKCGELALELGAFGTDELHMVKSADYIIIALSALELPAVIEQLSSCISREQVLINISTDNKMDSFVDIKDKCILAYAKIVGHAKEIGSGEIPAILVGCEQEGIKIKIAEIFSNMGVISFQDEEIVKTVNGIASEEGVKAALSLEKRLKLLEIPDKYVSFAIRNVASGVMKAYALGEAGPFVQEIISKVDTEK